MTTGTMFHIGTVDVKGESNVTSGSVTRSNESKCRSSLTNRSSVGILYYDQSD